MRAASVWSRRAFLRLSLGATTAAVLAACSEAGSDGPLAGARALLARPRAKSEVIQLVYQDWNTDWFPALAQKMLAQFHEQHPNIRVYFTPDPTDLEGRMLLDMRSGTAADVFQGCCTHFPIWAQSGYTLDLRPYILAHLDRATIADWDSAQYRSFFTRDGKQYGLPKYHGALALYYNRSIFDRYGVPYPTNSWNNEDYLAAMLRLRRPAGGQTPDHGGQGAAHYASMLDVSWDRIQVWVNAWGGHLVDPRDPTRCQLADPPALAAQEWLRARMWGDHTMARPTDVQNLGTRQAFASGLLAMVEDGSWALRYILENARFPVGLAPLPEGPARRATLATTDGFGIYSGTKYPDAAWELLQFLISKDYGRAMAREHLLQPARASLLAEWATAVSTLYPDKAEGLDTAAFADGHLKGYSVTSEVFSNMAEAKRLAYAAWERILILGQGQVAELTQTCREIEAAQLKGR